MVKTRPVGYSLTSREWNVLQQHSAGHLSNFVQHTWQISLFRSAWLTDGAGKFVGFNRVAPPWSAEQALVSFALSSVESCCFARRLRRLVFDVDKGLTPAHRLQLTPIFLSLKNKKNVHISRIQQAHIA